MTSERLLARIRLASGLLLMLFAAGHLTNLALGLRSIATMEQGRAILLSPWQTVFGQAVLLAAVIAHAGLGLRAIAARRSLAMSRADRVQIALGLATPPLLLNHVASLQVTSDLNAAFQGDYGYVLAVYWSFAPMLALQQLLVVVIVWAHGAIGVHAAMVIRPAWPRLAPVVLPLLFAVPILALLGFAEAGRDVVARLSADPAFAARVQQGIALILQERPRLEAIKDVVLISYGAAAATALGRLAWNILARRSARVTVSYDGGLVALGRPGLTVLDVSRAQGIPHASVCSGRGRCGTCMVIVSEGGGLDGPREREAATLARIRAPQGARLACQAHLLGAAVTVRRAYPAFADAEAARLPAAWAGSEEGLDGAR